MYVFCDLNNSNKLRSNWNIGYNFCLIKIYFSSFLSIGIILKENNIKFTPQKDKMMNKLTNMFQCHTKCPTFSS